MEKSRKKVKRLLGLDKIVQHIAQTQKCFARQRRERAEKSFHRSMLQLLA